MSLRPLAPPTNQRTSTRSVSATSSPSVRSPPTRTVKLVKTQAEKLREYRIRNGRRDRLAISICPYICIEGRQRLSESLLLRDTLYLLQGISGKYVRFASPNGGREPDLAMNRLVFSEDSVSQEYSVYFRF
jgi:gamma-tubulin complex component 3